MTLAIPFDEDMDMEVTWVHVWLGFLSLAAAVVGVWKLYESNRMREMARQGFRTERQVNATTGKPRLRAWRA